MTPAQMRKLDAELREYIESMVADMGRLERRRAMEQYLLGLLLDGERKSVEPMAARLVDQEHEREAMRQRLQQCVSVADWSDAEMRRRLALKLEQLPEVEAFVVDDTGFPKKGKHSVGVARQYSGTLGRTDNCQVAVSLHLAGEKGSGCIGMQLYLPQEWAKSSKRRKAAGVPKQIRFQRKWQIALEHWSRHCSGAYASTWCWPTRATATRGSSVTGCESWACTTWWECREGTRCGRLGRHRCGLPRWLARTAAPARRYVAQGVEPWSIEQLARQVPKEEFHTVSWREGSRGQQSSRFAAVRVHTAERHVHGAAPSEEVWLLLEWPKDQKAPKKYYLCSLPRSTPLKRLAYLAKLRWRVERDYQELKGEVGLDHFEGRTWRGFHHHVTLCMVAHAFLALRRALFPPEQNALDSGPGAPPPSAPAAAPHRPLPALPTPHQRPRSSSGTVAHVIT